MDEIGSFSAVLCMKLAQNTLYVLLHGLLGDMQSLSNSAIPKSLADEPEDLVLPCCQLCQSVEFCTVYERMIRRILGSPEWHHSGTGALHQVCRQSWTEHKFITAEPLDHGYDLIWINILFGAIALCSSHDGCKCFLLVLFISDRHNAGSRRKLFQTAYLRNTIRVPAVHLQPDDIRGQLLGLFLGLSIICVVMTSLIAG
jgi:hypothetical protein